LTLKGSNSYAEQLESEVKLKFDNLEGSINDTRDDLLQTLADQYRENVTQLEKTFNEINDELKKSWIDRAIEFVKTVGRRSLNLANCC
jgi:DNA anti-recombination protein RmuC